jgi:hypothetical protein
VPGRRNSPSLSTLGKREKSPRPPSRWIYYRLKDEYPEELLKETLEARPYPRKAAGSSPFSLKIRASTPEIPLLCNRVWYLLLFLFDPPKNPLVRKNRS